MPSLKPWPGQGAAFGIVGCGCQTVGSFCSSALYMRLRFIAAVQLGSMSPTQDAQVLDLTSLRSSRFAINRSLQPGRSTSLDRCLICQCPIGLVTRADFTPRHFVIKNQDADTEEIILDLAPGLHAE